MALFPGGPLQGPLWGVLGSPRRSAGWLAPAPREQGWQASASGFGWLSLGFGWLWALAFGLLLRISAEFGLILRLWLALAQDFDWMAFSY